MRKIGLVAASVVAAVGGLTACSDSGDSTDTEKAPAATAEESAEAAGSSGVEAEAGEGGAGRDVEITASGVRDHDTWGENAYVVEYRITNSGEEAANYFVGLEFLDADGDVLGSTGVTADKLGPGKSKKGETAPLDVEIENGELADIRDVRVAMVDRTPAT
ncbi:hypothetical protein IQ279_20785 [Streptomyces verrucosisporus]|nr:hypothetical protein [Streptomyces verrucosisporus]